MPTNEPQRSSSRFDNYGLRFSEDLRSLLQSAEAVEFRRQCFFFVSVIYNHIEKELERDGVVCTRLEHYLVAVAIDSAFLDLQRAKGFHLFSNGTTAAKTAAALTAWLNHFRPIQITNEIDPDDASEPFANAILALESGWSLMWTIKAAAEPSNAVAGHIREVISESRRSNDLIYDLMWRAPRFRELALLFEFVA